MRTCTHVFISSADHADAHNVGGREGPGVTIEARTGPGSQLVLQFSDRAPPKLVAAVARAINDLLDAVRETEGVARD